MAAVTQGLPALRLEAIAHAYGAVRAVDGLDLAVGEGELVCLLGPSGCGKSTVLRLAAGLESLQTGRVYLRERIVAAGESGQALAPELRGIGLVFQESALFPHLSVAENIAFGLRGFPAARKRQRVAEMLAQVDMRGFAQAYPHMLSGGQAQRVALARALAPMPKVMLLDEPFSGLDARLRALIRDETLHLLKRSGVATLLVTHDPEEALFMADRIYLMRAGRIVQSGTPLELYRHPVDPFAAGFFQPANEFRVRIEDGMAMTPLGPAPAPGWADGAEVLALVRPESIVLHLPEADAATSGIIADSRFIGIAHLARVMLPGLAPIEVRLPPRSDWRAGDRVSLRLLPEEVLIFPLPSA